MASCRIIGWMAMIMVIEMVVVVSQVAGEEECGNGVGLAVLVACGSYIDKDKPKLAPPADSDCCKAVNSFGMKCTCDIITKEIEQTISMEKLVFVAATCGQPLPPGTQCGSYKVPPVA